MVEDNGSYAIPGANVMTGPQGKFSDGSTFTFEHAIRMAGKTEMTVYGVHRDLG